MMVSRETTALRWISDRGLCIFAGAGTLALYRRLQAARLPEVEIVPADGMLMLVLSPGAPVPAGLLDLVNGAAEAPDMPIAPIQHRIPVRFDGEDLSEVAGRAKLAVEDLVGLLCSLSLRVKFLGFQPGFAYLDGLPPALQLPRRANPRKQVPAGSLALGGGYCGIYPAAGPGGWHLLGMTEERLFDPSANPPARLQPGDTVSLVAA